MSRQERYIEIAENAARLSSLSQTLGAVVVRSGKILAVAGNRWRNDPANVPQGHAHLHAEKAAATMVRNPAGCAIYVVRLTKNGKRTMSRPCFNCWNYLKDLGFSKVIYTDWSGNYIQEKFS
jgi:tRNA(Arg) A34 adenosine deaminase TadA